MRTRSEELFERWCGQRRLHCEPIPVPRERRADYRVRLASAEWIAEVKEFELTAENRKTRQQLDERGWADPVDGGRRRVELKIKDSVAQLKALCGESLPGVLILYSPPELIPIVTDPYGIMTAMYGQEAVRLRVPGHASPTITGRDFGGKRNVGPTRNRSLSAIGAMYLRLNGRVRIVFFHNAYARVPLTRKFTAGRSRDHYELSPADQLTFSEWVRRRS